MTCRLLVRGAEEGFAKPLEELLGRAGAVIAYRDVQLAGLATCVPPRVLTNADLEQLVDTYIGKPGIALKEDPELSRGSLRLESPEGVLEATLERRRARLLELLHQLREKGLE